MVLVDTSVWIEHLRGRRTPLPALLLEERVLCHPFVIGELACGNLRQREEILFLLRSLPFAVELTHDEIIRFIERWQLAGKGLGYIDIHLLASAMLSGASLLSLDRRLRKMAKELAVGYS